mgnify:CR=1 FL=1
MENTHAVHNGIFNYLDEIKISPLSRAYTFSDSVYEVIPFFNSKIIAFDDHIERLKRSCKALSMSIDIDVASKEITNLIRSNWSGPLGIHTHDSQGLALSNTLESIKCNITWLDSTITGIGRGPGNAKTEELIIELQKFNKKQSHRGRPRSARPSRS